MRRGRVASRGVPRGSGCPQSAKGVCCSCFTTAAAPRPRGPGLMLNVPMPPGSKCWWSGFSAGACGGGGLSSGCRKSCVLRNKPARTCTGRGYHRSQPESCRSTNNVTSETEKTEIKL